MSTAVFASKRSCTLQMGRMSRKMAQATAVISGHWTQFFPAGDQVPSRHVVWSDHQTLFSWRRQLDPFESFTPLAATFFPQPRVFSLTYVLTRHKNILFSLIFLERRVGGEVKRKAWVERNVL